MGDGREEQARFLRSLRAERIASFRKEIVPYFRYVVQSGFGLAVSAGLFTLIIGYARLLDDVPADLQAGYIGAAAIALAAMLTPMRIYLRAADPVFLLPMETRVLEIYLRASRIAAMRGAAIRTAAVFALFVPLYVRAPLTEDAAAGRSLLLLGLLLAALGVWNAYGGWRERQMAFAGSRIALRAARYAATLSSAGALIVGPSLPALGVSLASAALVTACWRLPVRHALPWDKLIREEAAARRRWMRFLGWFVDVPTEESRPVRRVWAAWAADRRPLLREGAWRFLYAKTFIRGETFGTYFRWYAVMAFVVIAVDHPVTDWVVYAIAVLAGGLQLTELGRLRLALSVETLPLDPDGRRPAAAAVARTAGITAAAALWLCAALPQGWPLTWLAGAGAVLAAGWSGWIVPRRVAKARDEEDE